MADDESTLTFGPDDSLTGSSRFPSIPALTIIWHPDLDRVGDPPGDTHKVVKEFLARKEPSPTSDPESALVPVGRAEITKEQLLVVLERANWNHARAAKILGVSRTSVWRWITKDPDLLRIFKERSTGTYRKS